MKVPISPHSHQYVLFIVCLFNFSHWMVKILIERGEWEIEVIWKLSKQNFCFSPYRQRKHFINISWSMLRFPHLVTFLWSFPLCHRGILKLQTGDCSHFKHNRPFILLGNELKSSANTVYPLDKGRKNEIVLLLKSVKPDCDEHHKQFTRLQRKKNLDHLYSQRDITPLPVFSQERQ